jgi:hypothetical protein
MADPRGASDCSTSRTVGPKISPGGFLLASLVNRYEPSGVWRPRRIVAVQSGRAKCALRRHRQTWGRQATPEPEAEIECTKSALLDTRKRAAGR